MSEAAVKRSDLENFDPDTPLEKLHWAREEMQRNFQQPMSARAMRVCTSCSERWDTAEDGGSDYRWVVYHVSREHSTAAVGFRFGLPHNHTLLFGCIINSSISSKHVHCCINKHLVCIVHKNENINIVIPLLYACVPRMYRTQK